MNNTNYIKIYEDAFGIIWDHQEFQIHHINGDHADNDIDNLILLPTDLHRAYHKSMIVTYGCDLKSVESRYFAGVNACEMLYIDDYLKILGDIYHWGHAKNMRYRRFDGVVSFDWWKSYIRQYKMNCESYERR